MKINQVSEEKLKIIEDTLVNEFDDQLIELVSGLAPLTCSFHPDREAVVYSTNPDDGYKSGVYPLCKKCYLFKIELLQRRINGEAGGW